MRDRVDAVGGELVVRRNDAGGTDVAVSIPLGVADEVH
jgi:signal transduction histidine kinase